MRDYGVPDYGFGVGVALSLGGEGGHYVDEDLLCVPGEEGCEICMRVVHLVQRFTLE